MHFLVAQAAPRCLANATWLRSRLRARQLQLPQYAPSSILVLSERSVKLIDERFDEVRQNPPITGPAELSTRLSGGEQPELVL
jgi:hypothetical protein